MSALSMAASDYYNMSDNVSHLLKDFQCLLIPLRVKVKIFTIIYKVP